ncbi:MAG: hypothetical protein COY49_01575 [Comamonadaceae bacterium CG_4_10_14_0_8_um_filter_57_29]|nr:MAG: hypothetical protein AUK51_16725 [Comamonadaceae bacterium CG2_30_59_20]PIZ23767.1 MAG: hypothetical protein COY49_01575 [Comamonadaceae bacterium CG_4_10_14_0_8_um_filter_57_29]
MNTPTLTRRGHPRRKLHYVDETLQKFFLVGLVLLEAALAAGLTWLMWQHLNQIVDDNLYRVHLNQAQPILAQLMQKALQLLGIFFAANLLALVLVDAVWRRYVNAILARFMRLMRKSAALDFNDDPATRERHQVLNLAESQRDKERQRLTEIRTRMSLLPEAPLAPEQAPYVADAVHAMKRLLPMPPTHAPAARPVGRRRSTDPL